MSTNVLFNGSVYVVPAVGEDNWGDNVSNYLIAIGTGCLQKSGGTFTLTAETYFGATYGLKSQYFKSAGTNISTVGILRLANAELVSWRNAANNANLSLTVNASNQLTFDGHIIEPSGGFTASRAIVSNGTGDLVVATTTATEIGYVNGVSSAIQTQLDGKQSLSTLTTKGDLYAATASATVTRLGVGTNNFVLTAASGQTTGLIWQAIVDASISASAAIALSKLAATTASRALVSDGSGLIAPATTTSTEIGYVNGVTSAIQTQLDAKAAKSLWAAKGDLISATAASTPGSLTVGSNDKVLVAASGQATGLIWQQIVNAQVDNAAAIAVSKLAALTASRAAVTDASGFVSAATTTSTEIGYVNGVTSAIQTQLDARTFKSTLTTKGDIYAATAASTPARLAVGTNGQVLVADSTQTTGIKWSTNATTFVGVKYVNTAGTSITASTATVPFATQIYDTDSSFNGGTGVWTCASDGTYLFVAQLRTQAVSNSTSASFSMTFLVTSVPESLTAQQCIVGALPGNGASQAQMLNCSKVFKMAVGDTFSVQADNSNTIGLDTTATRQFNSICITKMGS